MKNGVEFHYRTCNLCEAMCGLEIEYRGDEILAIRGDKNDPFSHGHICPKATALEDIYRDPDRLKQPMRRTADGWEQIGWDEAFDEVVTQIQAIQAQHGHNAIGVYQGNPNVHNAGAMIYSPPFVRALRTRNRFSATSADQLPHHFAGMYMFGHPLLMPIPDVDRTDYMLILGANPVASNGSIMTAAGIKKRLQAIQKRRGQVVVIDPRRSETAVLANTHHFIKPGTDALFLLGLLHVIHAEGLDNPGEIAGISDGLEQIQTIAVQYPPKRVAAATGIDAETIRQIARDFCGAETAVCYGRIGVSTQQFGGLCQWLINVINIVTGNFDKAGGAMFPTPAIDVVGLQIMTGGGKEKFGRWHTRVRDLPEFGGELPVSALAEEILTEGEGQIRGMVTVAGNPVLSSPNGAQLDEAFASLDFMVAIDIYINETTRHANIILPPTTGLETEHYDLIFHALAVRNTAKYSQPLFEPSPNAKHDWEIFQELRFRLEGNNSQDRQQYKLDLPRRLPPSKVLDLGLRFGPYGARGVNGRSRQKANAPTLTLSTLKREKHGVDLGPMVPMIRQRLCTKNGRIQLAPEILTQDLARLEETLRNQPAPNGHLLLIGRRQLRSNNSWMHNAKRLVRGKDRCTLLIHPDDAAKRSISDKSDVQVTSRAGTITLPAEISDEMMAGVVSIPHGWGHDRDGVQLSVAQQHAGASINDITDEQLLDDLTGNAAFSGVPVEVEGLGTRD